MKQVQKVSEHELATNERRRVRMLISPQLILSLLRPSDDVHRITVAGLPEGAQVVGTSYDYETMAFCIFLEHESFEPVPDYAVVPIITPHYTVEYYEVVQ